MADQSNSHDPHISEEPSDITFAAVLAKPYVNDDLRQRIAGANVILLPQEGFRDNKELNFPLETAELFQFMRENASKGVTVGIAVTDEDYNELALNFDVIVLATMLVSSVVVPLVINLVSDYINPKILGQHTTPHVKIKMLVQDNQKGTTRLLEYEGPGDQFSNTMTRAVFQLDSPKREQND